MKKKKKKRDIRIIAESNIPGFLDIVMGGLLTLDELQNFVRTAHDAADRLDVLIWAGTSRGHRGARGPSSGQPFGEPTFESIRLDMAEVIITINDAIKFIEKNKGLAKNS